MRYIYILVLFLVQISSKAQKSTLVFPKSGEVITGEKVNLICDPDTLATTYSFQISSDRFFSSPSVYNSSNPSYLIDITGLNSWVYWKVISNTSVSSNIDSFFVFNSNSFSGCVLWMDPDSLLYETSSQVDSITDLSSYKHNVYQTDLNQKPSSFIETKFNKKILLFSGQQGLLFPLSASNEYHFFSFASPGQILDNYETILSSAFSPNARWAIGLGYNTVDGAGWGGSSGSVAFGKFSNIFSNQYYLVEASKDMVQWKLNLNSNYIKTITDPSTPSYYGTYLWNIGNESGYNRLSGMVGAVIIYNKVLADNEARIVSKYFFDKYQPPVNLGPNIYHNNSFCKDTLKVNKIYATYLWSNGATTSSIAVNQSGKYWVKVTDFFGRESSDTIIVEKSTPLFFENDQKHFCKDESIIWNTTLSKQNFSFQWNDFSNDSLLIISSPGSYYVIVTDRYNCQYFSDTSVVTEDLFPSTTSLGPDTNLCSGNSISLKHGNLPGNIYQWNDHSTGSSLAITNSGQYSVVVTNTNNCVAKDTINVTIVGQAPTASISNSPGCKLASTNFTDMSSPPAGNSLTNWRWDFGVSSATNDTSLLQNPTFTYADTGTYVVQLTVKTDVGCVQTTTTSVYVTKKPFVNFTYPIACQNASLPFTGSVNTYSYPIGTYVWSFGDPSSGINNTSTLANPTHTFSQAMFYPVKLVVSNIYGCKDSIIKNINVNTEVAANFTYSSPCKNSPVSFQDNSVAPSPNAQNPRLWDFGDGTTTGLTAIKTYTNSGTYTVSLKVTGTNGCVSTTVKTIDVKLPPVAEYTYTNICVYDTLHLSDISSAQNGSLTFWNWSLDNASFSSIQNPTLSISSSAAYAVKLQVKNSFNCYDSITHIITAYSLPVVDFSTTPAGYYYINTPIAFSPNISNGLSYHWDFSSGSSSVQSPTVSFNSPNTYTVSLLLEDQQGCKNTSTKTIQVQKRFTDLGILDVRTDLGADRFYSVEADLANHGTTPITEFVISYQISNSGFIQESWKDSLKPGNVMTFHFNSKSFAGQYSGNRITCVNINSVNLTSDDNSSNDKLCRALNTSEIQVMEPFPNPSDGDITWPVVLMQDGSMSLMIYDALGQLVYEDLSISALSGLNLLQIPTATFQRGTYILKLHIGHDTFTKKFLKNSGK